VTSVSAPVHGEVLAGRYRLDETLSSGPERGQTLWRGTDTLLNRRVAIELRSPGGEPAEAMISGAIAAGRIIHPSIAGVYDAVDEENRAFVVREWVDGTTLSEALQDGPLEPAHAATIARAIAEALAAVHAAGHAHGNLTPTTVLLTGDDSVSLTDLHLHPASQQQADIRALGGLLYASLTHHWPMDLETHGGGLPPALRVDGRLCTPRQVRAGVPAYLDALAMDLIDPTITAPSAHELAAELRRFDVADPTLGPLSLLPATVVEERPWQRRGVLIAGGAVFLVTAVALTIYGVPLFSGGGMGQPSRPSAAVTGDNFRRVPLVGASLVDARGAVDEADRRPEKLLESGSWKTDRYNSPDFGGLKSGMGVVLDLGSPHQVGRVTLEFSHPGATLQVKTADTFAARESGYRSVTDPRRTESRTVTLDLPSETRARYVLIWITSLPSDGAGKYQAALSEVRVEGR
jgi:hypothetical protein